MIDHVSLGVASLEDAIAFYDAALAPLGLRRLARFEHSAGYGPEGGRPGFWLVVGGEAGAVLGKCRGLHVSFSAASQAAVDAFHAAALNGGGVDDGAPGLRPDYHPTYYSAYAIDPEGYRIEAACRDQ